MKKRLVAMSLIAAFAATGAIASTSQHFATASTKKEAKRLATAEARAAARTSAMCFRPAYQVAECDKVEDGFRCRADSASDPRTCRRSGWLHDRRTIASVSRVGWWSDQYYDPHRYSSYPVAGAPSLYPNYVPPPVGWRPTEPFVLPPVFPQQPSTAK